MYLLYAALRGLYANYVCYDWLIYLQASHTTAAFSVGKNLIVLFSMDALIKHDFWTVMYVDL